ncbi:MAG: hypothetical protein K2M91_09665 [Lachnospiraceae bacterium]|nr:hypothetical protein [Lachnospiraceae bacterium]
MLYVLMMTDPELSYDNYSEDFGIGIFKTEKEAEEVAQYYLENVQGFCDYPCTYRIEKKEVVDNFEHVEPDIIWDVQGWNENDYGDEIDIVESACFLTKERAETELQLMKKKYQRSEWVVSRHKIGKLHWRDGFVRV